MTDYADLTLTLTRPAENQYRVELSFSLPDGQVEQAPISRLARFDFDALRLATLKPEVYGRLLKEALFGQEELRSFFKQCQAGAGAAGNDLRLRMVIDRSAVELQNLRWETLRDLEDQNYLARDANRPFSRFLYSSDWGQISLRSKGELHALVFVANPVELVRGLELAGQKLAAVDVAGEVARAQEGLKGIPVIEVLESQAGQPGRASLENLKQRLRQGIDILYLVCHGALLPDDPDDPHSPTQPYIILEKENGSYDRVLGADLANYIHDLPANTRPRLALLASCQSAGSGQVQNAAPDEAQSSNDQGALAALGPRLVEAGVPAVVAMQANIQMATIKRFSPAFFAELLQNGQVDKAMAVARGAVAGQPDWWAPVLYLRLRGGRLWYEPGFVSAAPDFAGWPNIINSIQQGYCVPILGFGLAEFLAGSPREIAQRWATQAGYPLASAGQDDLPQVAQYLAVQQGLAYPRDQLVQNIREHILDEFAAQLPQNAADLPLKALITEIGRKRRASDPAEAYTVLASLPFKIYVTANPDNLLEDALTDQGRAPTTLYARWKRSLVKPPDIQEFLNLSTPTVAAPLVYHLFGYIDNGRALVLTEDDYFDYMMWVNNPAAQIKVPEVIKAAWDEAALVFLGFQMNDWNFRVLFRSILDEQRRQAERYYRSMAVQLQPGDGYLKPESARRYLERAFTKDQLDIYWGSADDFLRELKKQWR
jgi:hypothetical protein